MQGFHTTATARPASRALEMSGNSSPTESSSSVTIYQHDGTREISISRGDEETPPPKKKPKTKRECVCRVDISTHIGEGLSSTKEDRVRDGFRFGEHDPQADARVHQSIVAWHRAMRMFRWKGATKIDRKGLKKNPNLGRSCRSCHCTPLEGRGTHSRRGHVLLSRQWHLVRCIQPGL